MSAGWVAGSVRARAMTSRRLGSGGVAALSAERCLTDAVTALASSPYGHDVQPDQPLEQAQRGVVASALWNARVLAGWCPRGGVGALRVLVGVLEVANTIDHLQRLSGRAGVPVPFELGALAMAWPRIRRSTAPEQVREVLASSAWGDPGSTSPADVARVMRASLADRTMGEVPEAASWAAGSVALGLARDLAGPRQLSASARLFISRVVGEQAVAAVTLPGLSATLPGSARWALAGVDDAVDLWRAEARWWTRVERDSTALVRSAITARGVVVGAVGLLAVDAWRVRAALEVAARGGSAGSRHQGDIDAVA